MDWAPVWGGYSFLVVLSFCLEDLHGNGGHLLPFRQQKCSRERRIVRPSLTDWPTWPASNEVKIKHLKCSLWGIFRDDMMVIRPPPSSGRAIDNILVTGDHNALSYHSSSLIISPGSHLNFSHIYQERGSEYTGFCCSVFDLQTRLSRELETIA